MSAFPRSHIINLTISMTRRYRLDNIGMFDSKSLIVLQHIVFIAYLTTYNFNKFPWYNHA